MSHRNDRALICEMAAIIAGSMSNRLGDLGQDGIISRATSMAFGVADEVSNEIARRDEMARKAITGEGI